MIFSKGKRKAPSSSLTLKIREFLDENVNIKNFHGKCKLLKIGKGKTNEKVKKEMVRITSGIELSSKSISYLTPAALSTYRSIALKEGGEQFDTQTLAKKATTKRF